MSRFPFVAPFEVGFVLASVGTVFGRAPRAGDSSYQPARLDWDAVLSLAAGEGLSALLYSGLRASRDEVPAAHLSRLRAAYLASSMWVEVCLEPSLQATIGRLGDLEPILIKGGALAYTAYSDPCLRSMSDLDMLLPPGRMREAEERIRVPGSGAETNEWEPSHHGRPHYLGDRHLGVELHRDLLGSPHPYFIDPTSMEKRSEIAGIAGMRVRVPAAEDSLHLACIHLAYAHQYRWHPLRSLVDVLAITSSRGRALDWDLFLKIVREARTRGAVYWPLQLATDLLGSSVPQSILSDLAPSRLAARLISSSGVRNSMIGLTETGREGQSSLDQLLLALTLYSGCGPARQARALVDGLFPRPQMVGHLPPEILQSRLRYSMYLARPGRFLRGILATGRMFARMVGG